MASNRDQGPDEAIEASDGPDGEGRESFASLLAGCRFSAVHLEQRDVYTPADPDFLRWRDGDHFDPVERWQGWIDLLAPVVARGVSIRRLRIVSVPVTDYIRYEYGVTPMNVAAGESVRWLPRRRASDLALPGNDYWVFDDRVVQFNHFAGDGSSLGPENRGEPSVVSLCLSAFEAGWKRSIPHADFEPT
ncbi:DUF6879 family protein [Actinomadura geliboluensis]|uniref:DUF6879 family protein n=1 Tax=Actinomadura geliboluensis TaxID=882440 RepID=UPI0033BD1E5A